MYDLIEQVIAHVWQSTNYSSTEQQIIYYICGTLIIMFVVVIVDVTYRVFRHFWR